MEEFSNQFATRFFLLVARRRERILVHAHFQPVSCLTPPVAC
jgi:hypothetical protein